MILKASQRSGGKQLARHLLRTDENDHVEVHSIRGFLAGNLKDALNEAYAVSRGTRCKQYLFSVSFSPPDTEKVDVATFERAIDELESRVGLEGQPRVIVFHEKSGRRHAHCVWSRIRAADMRAINLSHFKFRLRDLSRELYIENRWTMPRGLVKSEERNPLNFTREEWQQALRAERDPKAIKEAFQDCWAISDSRAAFRKALETRGFYLAQGDRRGFVAIDHRGEVYSVSRWVGVNTKLVNAKLGDPSDLPGVEEVQRSLSEQVERKLAGFAVEVRRDFETVRTGLLDQKRALVARQRQDRQALDERLAGRWMREAQVRAQRFRSGLKGLWDRLVGRHAVTLQQNCVECDAARIRDAKEREALIQQQLEERRSLQRLMNSQREELDANFARLRNSAREQPRLAPRPRRPHRWSHSPEINA